MTTAPDLILFDLMDTLLAYRASGQPYWRYLAELVERHGFSTREEFDERYGKWREDRGEIHAFREVTLQERLCETVPELAQRRDALAEIVDDYMSDYAARTRVMDGVEAMLRAWSGVPLGVVSNFFVADFPDRLLRANGLRDYFGVVIDSSQVGFRKPAPEIFRAALERAGVREPRNVIFVGDDESADMRGARAAGMRPIHYVARDAQSHETERLHDWALFRPGLLG